MSDTEYKNSIKEINKLYSDRGKRAAARKFMLSCKESGIAYPVALDLLKASAAVNPDLNENANLKPLSGDHVENKTENTENRQNMPLTGEVLPNVETITDAGGLNMAEIENKIYTCMSDFMERYNIEDMTKASQNQWTAYATYNGKHLFKGTDILKQKKLVPSSSACAKTTNNAYDLDKIAQVLNFFIYLCNIYDKTFTYWAAAAFLGVNDDFLNDHAEKLTRLGVRIQQKSEQTLADAVQNPRKNITGVLATLNHWHNWTDKAETAPKTQNNVYIFPALGKLSPGVVPELPQVTE